MMQKKQLSDQPFYGLNSITSCCCRLAAALLMGRYGSDGSVLLDQFFLAQSDNLHKVVDLNSKHKKSEKEKHQNCNGQCQHKDATCNCPAANNFASLNSCLIKSENELLNLQSEEPILSVRKDT